ncbi:MAG TPA: putative peptidoglycan glycosyltransferase FtsW [Candidatus Eisenbacteria bacterium]|nr:putative peptidoglycan glycosyltransferase FtsW [Candidatus Eisenbacteria bacterium]
MSRVAALRVRARAFFRVDLDPVRALPGDFRATTWDTWLIGATFGLVVLGLTMVYSATSPMSTRPSAYLESHLMKIAAGVVAFAIGSRIDYHRWGRWAPWLYVLGLGSLLLVYVPGVGHSAGNARRWISLGGFTLQPADFARLGLVVYLALLLSKPRARLERFTTGTLPCVIALTLVAGLVYRQPNLSTTLALAQVCGLMLIAGKIPWRHLGILAAPVLLVLPFAMKSYQSSRIANWLDYWRGGAHLQGGNYQMDQSILAIGSGGLLGRGLGEGRQKWFFLPDAHTDFVFAIIGEELGFLGALLVVGLFLIVLWRAFEAARRAPDRFGYLLATGIGASIAIYAGVNLMVASGLFPTTGLPLPLVSYGGSAILVTLLSIGILNNIAAQGDSALLAGIGDYE